MNLQNMKRSEKTEQILVFDWCRSNIGRYPVLEYIYHNPNGGTRNKAEAAVLKRMGVKAGISDIHLPVARGRYIGLWIEMKYGDGDTTKPQSLWIEQMKIQGHYTRVCWSAEEACRVIEEYINLRGTGGMSC